MSIRKNIFLGVFYTAISKYAGILISIVIGAVLARLLSPKEFGTVAVVMVFIGFFNMLSDFGLGPAIVQNKQLSKQDLRSLFSFSILLSIIFSLFFFLLAPLIANFYGSIELVKISKLLSLSILFYSLRIVPYSLNLKKMYFKKIGITNVFIQIVSGVGAIILAYNGYSYYSLVYKAIFDGFATFLVFYLMTPILPVLKIELKSIKKVFSFSIFQFLFNFINYFSRNTDNLLIGKFLGTSSLGYYNKSYQLMLLPVQNLTHVITPVLLPVLSEFQDDKAKVFKYYCRVVEFLAIIGLPLSVFLYFSSSELILLLYGEQWEQSIGVFKILALTIGIQMVLTSSGSIFQALDKTGWLFVVGFLNAVYMLVGISYGVFYERNFIFVGYGILIAFLFSFFQTFSVLIKVVLNQSFLVFLKLFIKPIFTSITLVTVLYGFSFLNIENIFYSLFFKSVIALLVFIPFFLSSSYYLQMIKKIKK